MLVGGCWEHGGFTCVCPRIQITLEGDTSVKANCCNKQVGDATYLYADRSQSSSIVSKPGRSSQQQLTAAHKLAVTVLLGLVCLAVQRQHVHLHCRKLEVKAAV